MVGQILEIDTGHIIEQQPQPPPEQPVPLCKRFLQLDVPTAEAPAPAPPAKHAPSAPTAPPAPAEAPAPLVPRALVAPPAKKMKLTSAPLAKAPKKDKAPPVEKATEMPALTDAEIIEQFVAQKHVSADYGPLAREHELLLVACEELRILHTINNGTYDGTYDSE